MAEDEDGASNKKSTQNSYTEGPSNENDQNATKPDTEIEKQLNDNRPNGEISPTQSINTSIKLTGAIRKEENPFSFRHFLKRDLSLPGNSTYENTGARPKVYANTVQHSPTRLDVHAEQRRDKSRTNDTQAKEKCNDGCSQRISDNTSSSSSIEVPFSVVDNSESKHNLYTDSSEMPFYHRPNLASESLGMPSLPDFVQDHILVEQAYLNTNGPISVDLDNLPDFTFNTNFNAGSSSSLGRRGGTYSRNRNYEAGVASTSSEGDPSREIPLDLPVSAEASGPIPLDLPPHLSLDLTESVNPSNRRNITPPTNFPLDLPQNAGAESMRLPDFLPMHPGRTSPEPEHQDEQLQQILSELERTRCELVSERGRAASLAAALEAERRDSLALRSRLHAATRQEQESEETADPESTIAKLRNQIKKLKEELAASRAEARALRAGQSRAAAALRSASSVAEVSLRDLLAGLDQLKTLSNNLEPT